MTEKRPCRCIERAAAARRAFEKGALGAIPRIGSFIIVSLAEDLMHNPRALATAALAQMRKQS